MSNPITPDSSSSNTQQTSLSPPLSFSHSLSSSPPSLSLTPINNEIDTQRKKGGRPHAVVWNYFNKGIKISSGHYVADCKSCGKHWNKGSPTMMEHHLAFECPAVNDSVKYAFLEVISKRDNQSVNQSNRRIWPSNQTGLEDFIESTKLTTKRKQDIDQALTKAVVVCNLSFQLVENPYFIEFIKQLRTAYEPPSRKMLSDRLINEELGRITVKMNKLLENSENLTLGGYINLIIN